MNEQKLKEIAYYFDGYGSPHDDDILKLIDEYKRYREVVTQAISDLENECLWDALVKLKALEESS